MPDDAERVVKTALWRGFRKKCPSCGEGSALHKYLKVKHTCDHCGLELHYARTDDGPAYFTLCVVVAIVFPLFPIIYVNFAPEPWIVATSLIVFATLLALVLLPRIKGMFIGLQWANRLYGF